MGTYEPPTTQKTGSNGEKVNSGLAITRKEGQSIKIGDDIEVIVQEIRGRNSARIRIIAPPHIRILRSELTKEG